MREYLLFHMTALVLGILLDQIVGDPHGIPHPVRAMGRLILFLEKRLYTGGDPGKDRRRGALLWWTVILTVSVISFLVLYAAYRIHFVLGIIVEMILTCYILAARSLCRESKAVSDRLREGGIPAARRALSMIVGRDTAELEEEEIIKAAVETVAENTSDGVVAPLIYTILGGPVLGLLYKAVNTMDSMLGYQNERYEHFGWFAAKADDVFNYLPSRISALAMLLGSRVLSLFSCDYNTKNGYRIWVRDRRKHRSPNSAQTESVCAGALGLCLGGTHLYQGIPVEKPTIGDELRKPEVQDVRRANRLMFSTEGVVAVLLLAAPAAAVGLTFL